ncbi:GNAT family N-acetyltransferase [Cellulomonas sp. IC4_254]|uniref:GNAT family N-acetyltransferase n=1 Tax=Cellulomonas sp. IC4_254 TaxID=2714040 RepID=UPI00141FB31A|nr:GNAT family N-acetyltransferase [Cellulomonas sp. IC4_254]NHT17541.1 GNAT family N-acetyltransferase [Cellulomonas sp. IC4_254]
MPVPTDETSPEIALGRRGPRVRIVHLTGAVFDALAVGDLARAESCSPVRLTAYFAGPDWRSTWARRSQQARRDPASTGWITGVIWDEDQHLPAGRAGFHGPPDADGMVEIGYAVDPAHRRRGYARAALEALLQRARDEPEVRTVRVTIAPGNTESRDLAQQYGFTAVGEQWDDEDGPEIIYEVAADAAARAPVRTADLERRPGAGGAARGLAAEGRPAR